MFQEILREFEIYEGEVDGAYGPVTELAVKKFQETSTKIQANGVIDEETRVEM